MLEEFSLFFHIVELKLIDFDAEENEVNNFSLRIYN